MTTLIAVYNSVGCVGRCDAKCYDAIHQHCDCICGGMNHGAGRLRAAANTEAHALALMEANQGDGLKIECSGQLVLFEDAKAGEGALI